MTKTSKSVILAVSIILLAVYLSGSLVKVKKISCFTQNDDICPREIIEAIAKVKPDNYRSKIIGIREILNQSPYVNDYLIQYQIFDSMKIHLNITSAIFAIEDKSENKFFMIDSDGIVIDEKGATNLPFLTIDQLKLRKGDRVDDTIKFAGSIIKKINNLYSVKNGIFSKDFDYVEFRINGKRVFMPTRGDIDYLVGGLQIIFSRLNDNELATKMNNISEIDLRFKNPVLR